MEYMVQTTRDWKEFPMSQRIGGVDNIDVDITAGTSNAPVEILLIDTLESVATVTFYSVRGATVIPWGTTDPGATLATADVSKWVRLLESPHTLDVDPDGWFESYKTGLSQMRIQAYPKQSSGTTTITAQCQTRNY